MKFERKYFPEDYEGKRFGSWEVLRYVGRIGNHEFCECRCDCGTIRNVRTTQLISGRSKSCGCVPRAQGRLTRKSKSHFDSTDRLYRIWAGVKQRCLNPHNKGYPNYGGRGITLCNEWMNYEPFMDWALSHGYDKSLSIDRIDVNGNYEPSNCKWSTKQEQNRNRQYRFLVTYHGETKPLYEWTDILGKDYKKMYNRLKYQGFSAERAFEEPIKSPKRKA